MTTPTHPKPLHDSTFQTIGASWTNKPIALASLVSVFAATTSQAVITRDDVPDASYVALAEDPRFQSGRVIIFPEDEVHASGVLIGSRYILTAGHVRPFAAAAPADFTISIGGTAYRADYSYTHPSYPFGIKDRNGNYASGGFDLSIIRLDRPVTGIVPTSIWSGGLSAGQAFIGVGQGKSGSAVNSTESGPAGILRGYQNTIDYIYGGEETFNGRRSFNLLRSDFDSPHSAEANTLLTTLFADESRSIDGTSSATPMPLEGSTAAGDSGSGIWIDDGGAMRLAGIASFRYFASYGAQPGYVNLSNPDNVAFIQSVAAAEGVSFSIVPEPHAAALLTCGSMLMVSRRRKASPAGDR